MKLLKSYNTREHTIFKDIRIQFTQYARHGEEEDSREAILSDNNTSRRLTRDDVCGESSGDTYGLQVFGDEQQQQTPQLEDHLPLQEGQHHQEDDDYQGHQMTYEACLDETYV